MFRTKTSVDRHVQELFRKITDEKERSLRCYNIAKLYYQVGDFESARRYVSNYLEVKVESAAAHKLLAQINEALGQKEAALAQYQLSLELDGRQDDLILKVCELLIDVDISLDINRIKYWVDRAGEKFPHHQIVFQLKEKMLSSDRSGINDDLEGLIISELSTRPSDVMLRVKLIKYYISKNRIADAYRHAIDVEANYIHRDDLQWYETLVDVMTLFKETNKFSSSFWINYVASWERFAALSCKDGNKVKTIAEATQAILNFDSALHQVKQQPQQNSAFNDQMFHHMSGQLYYHLACLLLRKAKREQKNWTETARLCCPLLLSAFHAAPIDPTGSWTTGLKAPSKTLVNLWRKEGCYRCSQAAHVLQDYARDNPKKLMGKIEEFMNNSWRENIYRKIFNNKTQDLTNSYFVKHSNQNPPLRLLSATELKQYDEESKEVYPDSLHHHVWLGIVNKPRLNSNEVPGPYPNEYSHVFPNLQLSVYNLSQASPDSLGILDIDAFLNATILCSLKTVEEQQKSGLLSPERMPTLPADLTNTLCTSVQEKWWTYAYKIYRRSEIISSDIGEIRQEVQRGLEVIRCIGSHGLHPSILVHLARIFNHRSKLFKDKDNNDLTFIQARCELYWSAAVPLLERLLNNQQIRMISTRIFDYQGKEMSNLELSNALEEGRLLIACKYIRDKNYEQASDILQSLKCPEASFHQGEIYKKLADELVESLPKESITSSVRSQYTIMLTKARNCFYLTLDRLRSPGINPNHPLNAELGSRLAIIEDELWRNDAKNEADNASDESYSSAHSITEQLANSTINHSSIITPRRNNPRTPRQASTPRHHHTLDTDITRSRIQSEARPSPERLDAQIRQLLYTKDNILHSVMDQQKTLLESNKALTESNRQLQAIVEDLRKEMSEFRIAAKQKKSKPAAGGNQYEDDTYIYDEDYSDVNLQNSQPIPQPIIPPPHIPTNIYQPPRHPYSPLVYPNQLSNYYTGLPFNDPAQLQPFYPPRVFPLPALYPSTPDRSIGIPKVPDMMQPGMLQQNLFNSHLINPLHEIVSPPQNQVPVQPGIDLSSTALAPKEPVAPIKNVPVNKDPPVNVTITSSDTVPTSASTVQPTLSIVIPPQHRKTTAIANSNPTVTTSTPHNYQILMPTGAKIPSSTNLPSFFNANQNVSSIIGSNNIPLSQDRINTSVVSTGSHNSSIEAVEVEHDPIPDFQPVIPLPAEVKVTTGEEDEETLFCARGKLFRFADKEWKDRGVGNVKLLRNKDGKVRLLMRRDQVLKICANHLLSSDMELKAMPSNDKAWTWAANDYADEEVRLEKLCIKFKLVEEAQLFKEKFDQAKTSIPSSPPKIKDQEKSKAKEVDKKTDDKPSSAMMVGGFSFTSTPVIQSTVSADDNKPKQTEEPAKPSPFAGFSFSKSEPSMPATGFSFAKTFASTPEAEVTSTSKPALRQPQGLSSSSLSSVSSSGSQIMGTINDDNEAVLFNKNASLMRSTGDSGQWKDRGMGSLMLLLNEKSRKLRILMRKLDTSKLSINHMVTGNFMIMNLSGASNVLMWSSTEQIKTGKYETYAVSFKDSSEADDFRDKVNRLVKIMVDNEIPVENIIKNGKTIEIIESIKPPAPKSLSEMFKPAAGSWECAGCYTRNTAGTTQCVACSAPSSVVSSTGHKITEILKPQTPISVLTSAANLNTKPSFGGLFKPQPDTWECKTCYIRNVKSDTYCIACDSPVDPSMPPKPKPNDFGLKPNNSGSTQTFTFGFAQQPATATSQSTNLFTDMLKGQKDTPSVTGSSSTPTFSFGLNSQASKDSGISGFTFKAPVADVKLPGDNKPLDFSMFGKKSESKDFIFGNTQKLDPPTPNTFAFGSPGKSFDFQFSSKSPVKSPGAADVSEDEVAESEDVYFAPVIPLPDKVEVKTGEEDEQVLYCHRAKLFRFDAKSKEWKERGLGDIKILRHEESQKTRFVMRREQTLKLCLNHFVTTELEITKKDDKTWMWYAADYSDGEIEYVQFACRFKTQEIAQEFKEAADLAISNVAFDANEESHQPSTPAASNKSTAQDVQVVYELKVTPEEKDAALKLKLPENFYAYKQKEDCPGCIGCKDPDVSLFESDKSKSQAVTSPTTPLNVKLAPPKLSPLPSQAPASTTSSMVFGGVNSFSFGSTTPTFGATPVFGGNSLAANDKDKKPSFVFGSSTISDTSESDKSKNLFADKTICSPTSATVNFGKSQAFNKSFGEPQNQGWVFGASGSTGSSIFGGNSSNTVSKSESSSTGFNLTATTPFSSTFGSGLTITAKTEQPTATPTSIFGSIANDSTAVSFGSLAKSVPVSSAPATSTPPATSSLVFGSTTASTPATSSLVFGSTTASTPATSSLVFGSTTASTPATTSSLVFGLKSTPPTTSAKVFGDTSIFGGTTFGSATMSFGSSVTGSNTKLPETPLKADGTTAFLNTDNITTFSSLAAKAGQPVGFKTDPNFSFAGAGQSLFGSKPSPVTNKNEKTPKKDEDNEEDDKGDDGQEYDPHYEPIIPLPDAIEVWTGEEDEEKVFSQRAKLYRFETETKEWKERGVGDMKLLHHVEKGTYRLLLRREQIHKIVCNFSISPDLEFQPLKTSDRSWMWVGMNYIEGELVLEQLAVRFKNPQLAMEFKQAIDKAQQELRERPPRNNEDSHGVDDYTEYHVEEEDDDENDEEDEDDHSTMFERAGKLFYLDDGEWHVMADGQLKMLYDSELYGARITFETASGELICNCVITIETEIHVDKNECIWTGIDDAFEPSVRRTLKAQFSSEEDVQEMYMNFQDGQDYARQADISEHNYIDNDFSSAR
ncbi:E3 SUMO-protein ligase RanBP2-like [Microplitis mediator]|uniref:E3 SUMO-protein ligase RanBP2-like n=1 Tax=Microplitis mediator TaxID=375433 RepID=UPI0025550DF8|nr:E3 SUMO-protein ligase RanBP2-like [Microplitis mediator]